VQLVNRRALRVTGAVLCGVVALASGGNIHGYADREPVHLLWRDPGEVSAKDLFWGPGNPERVPEAPFTFIEEDTGGTKPKVRLVDARGVKWSAKFDHDSRTGREVPAEIAASRIMWALGYLVEESYLVDEGVIEGIGRLERAHVAISPDGRFRGARFERRPSDVERLGRRWTLDENPFRGSKELSGLVIVAALLNNWDFRSGNTAVLRVTSDDAQEDWYLLSDLGTAFGRTNGGMFRRLSRWNVEHFEKDAFISRADNTGVEFHYRPEGKARARVPIDHARWFAELASKLSLAQLEQAFVAAGATDHEVRGFSTRLGAKIAELHQVTVGGRSGR